MSRNEVKAVLPVLQAYAEGKTIQVNTSRGEWVDLDDVSNLWMDLTSCRIKPEPREWWIVREGRDYVVHSSEESARNVYKSLPFEVIHVKEVA